MVRALRKLRIFGSFDHIKNVELCQPSSGINGVIARLLLSVRKDCSILVLHPRTARPAWLAVLVRICVIPPYLFVTGALDLIVLGVRKQIINHVNVAPPLF
jgi:hypothetical protein